MKNVWYLFKILWKTSKTAFLIRLLYGVLSAIVAPITILLTKHLLDSFDAGKSLYYMTLTVVVYFSITIVPKVCNSFLSNLFNPYINLKFQRELNNMVLCKSKTFDLHCYEDSNFFDGYTRAFFEADSRAISVFNQIIALFSEMLSLFSLSAIVVVLDPLLIAFCIVSIIVGYFFDIFVNKDNYQCHIESTKHKRMLSYVKRICYQPEYAKDIKMNGGLLTVLLGNYNEAVNNVQYFTKKYGKTIFWKRFAQLLIQQIIEAAVMLYLIYSMFSHKYAIGSFVALLNAFQQLTVSLASLFNSFSGFQRSCLYIADFKKMMEYVPTMEMREGKTLTGSSLSISLDGVCFKYNTSTNLVLDNINLAIQHGEHIAIVGPNGSGKSTLVKLLCGLYSPLNGKIIYNDINIFDISTESLRESISTVFQDFNVYGISLANNISKDSHYCSEKMSAAIEKADLSNVVSNLSQGIDTILSKEFENGTELSGGEMQKIAMASAFYKDSKLLIFDEPTSKMDVMSEKKVFDFVADNFSQQTTVLISHRLANVVHCDRIFYMNKGRIIESGTHSELMELQGEYARMFNMQSAQYKENAL